MKKDSVPVPLSPAEQALMDLIWRLQPVNVTDLLETVNQGRSEPIIRNTLQTQLKRLEAKGWLTREKGGPVAVYRATVAERGGRGSILAELKQRLFGGSGVSMVRCLMEDGGLTPDEVRELNQWIGSLAVPSNPCIVLVESAGPPFGPGVGGSARANLRPSRELGQR